MRQSNKCESVRNDEITLVIWCRPYSICPKNQPGKNKESNKVMCSLGNNTLEMAEVQRFAKRITSKFFYIG